MYTLHDNQDCDPAVELRPRVSVVIVTFHSRETIGACLRSLERQESEFLFEVIVVDNASGDGTVAAIHDLKLDDRFRLLPLSESRGVAAANEQAFGRARGEIAILLRPDSVLNRAALRAAVDHLDDNPGCGICDGSTFTALRRDLIDKLGFSDETVYLLNHEEATSLGLRAQRLGWEVHVLPDRVVPQPGGTDRGESAGTGAADTGLVLRGGHPAERLFHRPDHGLRAVAAHLGLGRIWGQSRRLVKRRQKGERQPSLLAQIKADLDNHGSDWSRQGFWALAVYRFGRWRNGIRCKPLRKVFSLFYRASFKMVQICAGIELPCEAIIGEGLRIDHFGGIIISGLAILGRNCVLREGVTIGMKNSSEAAPRLGDNVNIGSGAKIIGPIKIGSNVDILANAVVITDVPTDSVAVGIPARVIPKKKTVRKRRSRKGKTG